MNHTPFFSTEINIKRVGKALPLFFLCLLCIYSISSYFFNLIDTSLQTHYQNKISAQDPIHVSEPLVLGDIDVNLGDEYDKIYAEGADIFTKGRWRPLDYIEIERSIDNPEYVIEAGSITQDNFDIGNGNTLNLECGEIYKQSLSVPPYWGGCTLKANNNNVISSNIRTEISCEDYGEDFSNPTNCTERVGLVIYNLPELNKKYLFLSSDNYIGSPFAIMAYELEVDTFRRLFFDLRTYIIDEKLTRGGMTTENFYLAYTDDTKSDFRLVTYFYDPAMQNINAVYDEWRVTQGRLLLDKRVVSLRD